MTILTFNTTQVKKAVEYLKEPNRDYSFEEIFELEESIKMFVLEKLETVFHGVESPVVQDKILKGITIPAALQHNGLIYVFSRDDEQTLFIDIYVNLAKNTLDKYTSTIL